MSAGIPLEPPPAASRLAAHAQVNAGGSGSRLIRVGPRRPDGWEDRGSRTSAMAQSPSEAARTSAGIRSVDRRVGGIGGGSARHPRPHEMRGSRCCPCLGGRTAAGGRPVGARGPLGGRSSEGVGHRGSVDRPTGGRARRSVQRHGSKVWLVPLESRGDGLSGRGRTSRPARGPPMDEQQRTRGLDGMQNPCRGRAPPYRGVVRSAATASIRFP